jgi:hypothetical protein
MSASLDPGAACNSHAIQLEALGNRATKKISVGTSVSKCRQEPRVEVSTYLTLGHLQSSVQLPSPAYHREILGSCDMYEAHTSSSPGGESPIECMSAAVLVCQPDTIAI